MKGILTPPLCIKMILFPLLFLRRERERERERERRVRERERRVTSANRLGESGHIIQWLQWRTDIQKFLSLCLIPLPQRPPEY